MSTKTVGLLGRGAQDVHLDFHTAPELCNFSPQSTGAQEGHLTFTQLLSSDEGHSGEEENDRSSSDDPEVFVATKSLERQNYVAWSAVNSYT